MIDKAARMAILSSLIASLNLSGCATMGVPVVAAERMAPADAMKDCPTPPKLVDGTQEEEEQLIAKLGPMYLKCAKEKKQLIDFIQRGASK